MPENELVISIFSSLDEKHKIDNGIWIPFMKNGQLAQDSQGRTYILTKEAIDSGYKSYLGGYVDINHQDKIKGKVADVKREGEFAYFKPDGLDERALSICNSPAYNGVSQYSENLSSIENPDKTISVKTLRGKGISILLYPKTPGCPLTAGCGIPIASSIEIENIIMSAIGCNSPDLPASSYAWVEDPEKKETWHLPYKDKDGKVRPECVRAALAAIGGARTGKPMDVPPKVIDKLNQAAKTAGIEAQGNDKQTKSEIKIPENNFSLSTSQKIIDNINNGGTKPKMTDFTPEQIKDMFSFMRNHPDMITEDMKGMMKNMIGSIIQSMVSEEAGKKDIEIADLRKQNDQLKSSNEQLKSSIQITGEAIKSQVKLALDAKDAEIAAKQEYESTSKELFSVLNKTAAEKVLASKPTTSFIRSMIDALKESGITSAGIAIGSEVKTPDVDPYGFTVGATYKIGV